MDLNKDGSKDVVLPITKGYGTGERTLELHLLHSLRMVTP